MAIYFIRDLEKLTGIKAHTIRVWELRYNMLTPARTDTNIRYYTDENLRLLINIALLNRNGVKISMLAKMEPDDIAAKGAELTRSQTIISTENEALTRAIIDLDEDAFEGIFTEYEVSYGFERTITRLIYPFLDNLRVLWLTGYINPAQEKFIDKLIRHKLITTIDCLPSVDSKLPVEKIVLYAPEGESQDLTLLFLQYLMRVRQIQAIYLDTNTGLEDLYNTCQKIRPGFVLTILQDPIPRQTIQDYIDQAAQTIGDAQLLLTGAQMFIGPVNLPANARIIKDLEETVEFLDGLQ